MKEFEKTILESTFSEIQNADGLVILKSDEDERYIVLNSLESVDYAQNGVFITPTAIDALQAKLEAGQNIFYVFLDDAVVEFKSQLENMRLTESIADKQYRDYLIKTRDTLGSDWREMVMDKETFIATNSLEQKSKQKPIQLDNKYKNYVNDKKYEKFTPLCLRDRQQFVCWKYDFVVPKKLQDGRSYMATINFETATDEEKQIGRWSKIPYNPNKPSKRASSTDVSTWSNFETACKAVDKNGFNGVGIMFAKGLMGIDIDHCIDENGVISDRAKEVIEKVNSYTEYSPSGTGIHILAFGSLPGDRTRNDEFEMYYKSRFFTLTGNPYEGTFRKMRKTEETQPSINEVYEKFIKPKAVEKPVNAVSVELSLEDNAVLEKCRAGKNGKKFDELWSGKTTSFFHDDGTPDLSKHDMQLVGILAYYCSDAGQIDRLFRQSGLYRSKWDEHRGYETYGQRTINYVLSTSGSTKYNPKFFYETRVKPNIKNKTSDWLSLTIPKELYEKDYAQSKSFILKGGNLDGAKFTYALKLIKEGEENFVIKVHKDFIFTINFKGQHLQLNVAQMKNALKGQAVEGISPATKKQTQFD